MKPASDQQDPLRAVRDFIRAIKDARAAGEVAQTLLDREVQAGRERNLLDPEITAQLMFCLPACVRLRKQLEDLGQLLLDLGRLLGGSGWETALAAALTQQAKQPCECATCRAKRAEQQPSSAEQGQ